MAGISIANTSAIGIGKPACVKNTGEHTAQHDELTLGKVNHVAGVIDQRET